MGRTILWSFGVAATLAVMAAPVVGQGSSVATQSACVSARGHAAVAAPCGDASSIFYNPAALAFMPSALSGGFTAVYNKGSFTYDGGQTVDREAATTPVPHGYASVRFGDRLAAGFGVWAPYGLGIEWPSNFEGRYISWKSQLKGIYLQPTLAFQIIPDRLAIGGGPQIVLGGLELNQDQDAHFLGIPGTPFTFGNLGVPLNTPFAAATLSGDGMGFGAQVGLYFQANDRLSLGARYMHSVKLDLSGDAEFSQITQPSVNVTGPFGPGGTVITVPLDVLLAGQFQSGGQLIDQSVDAELTLPPQAVVGLRFLATPEVELAVDYQWTGWSTFDEIAPTFDVLQMSPLVLEYEDTHTFRLGGSYQASEPLVLRAGFVANNAATPDQTVTPILPEAKRWLLTGGLGYDFGIVRLDVFYNYLNQADRRGRVRSPPADVPGETLNVGSYATTTHLLGLTFSYGLPLR
jgi:long-chain fatty acid transport protein